MKKSRQNETKPGSNANDCAYHHIYLRALVWVRRRIRRRHNNTQSADGKESGGLFELKKSVSDGSSSAIRLEPKTGRPPTERSRANGRSQLRPATRRPLVKYQQKPRKNSKKRKANSEMR